MPNSSDWGVVRFTLAPDYWITAAVRATFHPEVFRRALLRSLKFRVSSVRSAFGTFTENMLCSIRHECGGLKLSRVELIAKGHPFTAAKWKYVIDITRVGRSVVPYLKIMVREDGKKHDSYEFDGPLFEFTGAIRRRTRGYGYLDGKTRKYNRQRRYQDKYTTLPPKKTERADVTVESLNKHVNLEGVTIKAWPDRTTRPRNAQLRRNSRE